MIRPTMLLGFMTLLLIAPASFAEPSRANWKKLPAVEDGPWEPCNFGGDGEVEIEAGVIKLGFGDPLTGVRLKPKFPKENFEIELEARRTTGYDFFCGLTFPVGEGNCSFVLGGWGGGVVGLSSIDQMDASENETTNFKTFDNEKWFKIRVRVSEKQVEGWIDDKVFVSVPRQDRDFAIRAEMDPTLPVGIACYQCTAEVRNVRWRSLRGKDSQSNAKQDDEAQPATNRSGESDE